jgi:hypothetical protein
MSIQGYAAPAVASPPPAASSSPVAAPGEVTPPLAADPAPAGVGVASLLAPPVGTPATEAPVEGAQRELADSGAAAGSGLSRPAAESGGERPPAGATLSVPDAALKLNVPERTLRNWIAAGTLPVVRPDPVPGRRPMIRIPLAAIEALLRDESFASRNAAAGGGPSPAAAAGGGQSPDQAAMAVLQARLEGAHTAARLHAQRRHEERERYEVERADLKEELEFLRERMVRAEEAEREMRLLMAQQTQTLQQATHALKAFTERPALPEPSPEPEPPPPKKVRWFWRRGG